MKFMDEVDIELVNQELNFQSQDNSLVIRGGCDLFTTKPIGTDRKLFKTIDKHLDQLLEDNLISQSVEKDRKHSINSLFGSHDSLSANSPLHKRGSQLEVNDREMRIFNDSPKASSHNLTHTSASLHNQINFSSSFNEEQRDSNESPFGPLNNISTRKTFSYLIAILNSTYPDHDFSSLQPTTENFHKINTSDEFMRRFNNVMLSLGKKENLLNWIWDTINVYMDFMPLKLTGDLNSHNSRQNSVTTVSDAPQRQSNSFRQGSPLTQNLPSETCQIYEFQPSDQSIIEDLTYPFQTMWSYYWFIYNKKKKRVAFIHLRAINKIHHSIVENRQFSSNTGNRSESPLQSTGEEMEQDVYEDEFSDNSMEDDRGILGDIEL